jgi:choline kinase
VTRRALLFATAPAADGPAAALLEVDGTPLVTRLLAQLATLEVARATVVARPAAADALRDALQHAPVPATVVVSADVGEDLRLAADVAQKATEVLVVARADLLLHREALAGLLATPNVATGILGTSSGHRGHWSMRTRAQRGRVVSAGSPYHRVSHPSGYFLGVLKVDPRDLGVLATSAVELADLWEEADEGPWEDELQAKVADWKRRQWQLAVERETGTFPESPEDPDPPLEPEIAAEVEHRLRVTREDATSLLLVGLVRGGVHVGSAYLRGFFYAQPRSREHLAITVEELESMDEDKMLLSSAVKATDGFFTTFFVSPYSRYIARFAARRGWTPNQMTTVSMIIGIAAAVAFATGSRAGLITGAVLLQAAFTVDCVDGQLARYTRQFSKLGAWLDSIFDRGKEYVVYVGLALGATRGFDDDVWTLAACALTLQTARHAIDFSWGALRQQAIATIRHQPLAAPEDVPGTRRTATSRPAGVATLTRTAPVAATAAPVHPPGLRGLASRGVRVLTALDHWTPSRWLKRIFTLPIGERFALISLTAALFTPRTTFVALLVGGGFACIYALSSRVMQTVVS